MIDKEYNKILKQYHKLSNRHILVVETDMPYSDVFKVVLLSDKIRKAGNEVKVKFFAPRQIQRRLFAALITLSRKVF